MSEPAAPAHSKRLIVLLTAMVAVGPLSTDLYLPSLPGLAKVFGVDMPLVQLTLSVFLVGFALSQLIYGPLSDRFGRRPVLMGGLAIYLLASVACAFASSVEALIVARFFQALGGCAGSVIGRAIVRDVYGAEGSARVLAIITTAMAVAPAVGPVLGGVLADAFGWRANFAALSLFGLLLLLGVTAWLAETNRHRGSSRFRVAQLTTSYGLLIRQRSYVGHVLVVAAAYSGIFAFISGSSFVFIEWLGLSPPAFGLCFGTMVVGYMIGTSTSVRIAGRLGLHRMIALGTGIAAACGALMFALAIGEIRSVTAVLAPMVGFMVGIGFTLPNAMAGAIGPFPAMAGAASALMGFTQMSVAALVGIGVAHFHDGTSRAMAFAIFAAGLGAAFANRLIVVPPPPVSV